MSEGIRYNYILVDVMNMYWRAYSANRNLTSELEDGTVLMTGGIYTSIKMIQKLERDYLEEGGLIYFLFEGSVMSIQDLPFEVLSGARSLRKELDPEYKASREDRKVDPEFYQALNFLQILIQNHSDRYVSVQIPDMEADDLVQPLIKDFSDDDMILFVSEDLDWARSLSDNVHWLKKNEIITPIEFKEKFGFDCKPNSLEMYKAFRGDGSDNIPKGVSGLRENVLVQLVQDYSSLKEIFNNIDTIDYLSQTWKEKIIENKARLRLNHKLIEFFPIDSSYLKKFVFPSEYNPNTLYHVYSVLGFSIEKIDPNILKDVRIVEKREDGFFEYERPGRI